MPQILERTKLRFVVLKCHGFWKVVMGLVYKGHLLIIGCNMEKYLICGIPINPINLLRLKKRANLYAEKQRKGQDLGILRRSSYELEILKESRKTKNLKTIKCHFHYIMSEKYNIII